MSFNSVSVQTNDALSSSDSLVLGAAPPQEFNLAAAQPVVAILPTPSWRAKLLALALALVDFTLLLGVGELPRLLAGPEGVWQIAPIEPRYLTAMALALALGPLLAGLPETGPGVDRFLSAGISALATLAALLALLPLTNPPPPLPVLAVCVLALGLGSLSRLWLWRALHRSGTGALACRTLLVGAGPELDRLVKSVAARQDTVRVEAILDLERFDPAGPGFSHRLAAKVSDAHVEQVLIGLSADRSDEIALILRALSHHAVDVRLLFEPPGQDRLHGLPGIAGPILLGVSFRPITGWSALLKAAEDYAIAGSLLLLTAPLMCAIALAIRLESGGPVLFRQRRTGFNNRDFDILKFRTMRHRPDGEDPADAEAIVQATRRDPRITRVGRILRRTSLDELPQLINVLRGEMSIVGPRPHAPSTRASGRLFQDIVAGYAARHRVKPGLTGFAQVNGWRGETSTEEQLVRRIECDMHYIAHWSLWLDLSILLRTALVPFGSRNAY